MNKTILLALTIWLCGCNAKNVEYRRWDSGGNLVENVRMGQVNFLYWFALNDFTIHTDPLDLELGNLQERIDPNAVELGKELIELGILMK